jgi:hypothetical protein
MKFFRIRSLLGIAGLLLMARLVLADCFPLPLARPFSAPAFPVGYFEVHSSLSGLPNNNIRALLVHNNRVFAGTEGGGLMIFADNAWQAFAPDSANPFPAPTVACLIKDADNQSVLAGTVNGLVRISLDGPSPAFALLPLTGSCSRNILSLAWQGKTLMVGTDREVGEYQGNSLISAHGPDSGLFPGGFPCAATFDNQAWFGTSFGVVTHQESSTQQFSAPGLVFGWVKGLEALERELYIGSSQGLFQVTGKECALISSETWFTSLAATPGSSGFFSGRGRGSGIEVEFLEESQPADEALNEGQQQKVDEYNKTVEALNRRITEFNRDTANDPVRSLTDPRRAALTKSLEKTLSRAPDLVGVVQVRTPLLKGLWAGTQENGVILFAADGKRRELTTENSKLPSNKITAIAVAENGETWIGTADAGILRYTRVFVTPGNAPVLIWEGTANLVRTGGERLFVGTRENGLLVFDPRTRELLAEYSPTTVPGFPTNVTGVGLDQQARLWVTGNRGVWMKNETGWHAFTTKQGLPTDEISCLEIDRNGKIYVAGGKGVEISRQLAVYNGVSFTPFSIEVVKAFLAQRAGDAAAALRGLGLIDTYMDSFDVNRATAALALYDDLRLEAEVGAMLGVSEYLLLGTRAGGFFAFYGAGFKRISREGTGTIKKVAGLQKRRNGDVILVADKSVFLMDGQHFKRLPPILGADVVEFTDLSLDDKNPDLFWVSLRNQEGGGLALYEDGNWTFRPRDQGVISFALTDPFLYFATEKGVYQILGR